MKNYLLAIVCLSMLGCGSAAAGGASEPEHHESASNDAPSRVLDDGSRLFGSEMDEARELIALEEIIANPELFANQVVKTEGEIASVCQRSGCWMEIRANADSPGVRVPMAGHSFFLPRDLAGSRATIEGTVQVTGMVSEGEQRHLESEGATAADAEVAIEATAVLVHP